MDYSAYFIDFDGTLVDSAAQKLKAFFELYRGVSENRDEIYSYLTSNQGRPRLEKFEYIQRTYLNSQYSVELGLELSAEFDRKLASFGIPPLMPGVRVFLETAHTQCFLAVVSAAPREQIIDTLERHQVVQYFDNIHGAECCKSEAILRNLSAGGVPNLRPVMIGDSIADLQSAHEAEVDFIGFQLGDDKWSQGVSRSITDFKMLL